MALRPAPFRRSDRLFMAPFQLRGSCQTSRGSGGQMHREPDGLLPENPPQPRSPPKPGVDLPIGSPGSSRLCPLPRADGTHRPRSRNGNPIMLLHQRRVPNGRNCAGSMHRRPVAERPLPPGNPRSQGPRPEIRLQMRTQQGHRGLRLVSSRMPLLLRHRGSCPEPHKDSRSGG